jgi:hypothetical protein
MNKLKIFNLLDFWIIQYFFIGLISYTFFAFKLLMILVKLGLWLYFW